MTDTTDPLVGQVFEDRYRIVAPIGGGGMGMVYSAEQLAVGRMVAVKLLNRELTSSLEVVRRFQTEARATSRLEHPHTIRVIDFGQTDEGQLYLVSELLEGEDLGQLLAREVRLSWQRAVRIAIQVLKSLGEAHAAGIVHRDLKPENIFLRTLHGEEDFVKVLDFGVAKLVEGEWTRLTKTGFAVGTPAYMAPEQAEAREIDHRVDLYAIGIILHELLSGEAPFAAGSPLALMMKQVNDAAPPLPYGVAPPPLERLIRACLAKDPAERPADADVVRLELEAILEGKSRGFVATVAESPAAKRGVEVPAALTEPARAIAEVLSEPRRWRWLWIGLAAVAAVAVAAAIAWPGSDAAEAEAPTNAKEGGQEESDTEPDEEPDDEPDDEDLEVGEDSDSPAAEAPLAGERRAAALPLSFPRRPIELAEAPGPLIPGADRVPGPPRGAAPPHARSHRKHNKKKKQKKRGKKRKRKRK